MLDLAVDDWMRAAAWLVIGVDLAEDLDMGEPFNGDVAHIGNSRKVRFLASFRLPRDR